MAAANGWRFCKRTEEKHLDAGRPPEHWRKVAQPLKAQGPLLPPACSRPHSDPGGSAALQTAGHQTSMAPIAAELQICRFIIIFSDNFFFLIMMKVSCFMLMMTAAFKYLRLQFFQQKEQYLIAWD